MMTPRKSQGRNNTTRRANATTVRPVGVLRWTGLMMLIALVPGSPVESHLLVRGRTLSELVLSAPVIVEGRVESIEGKPAGPEVTLQVERVIAGSPGAEVITFICESHHPPEYEVGERKLVFLEGPPWKSRQTSLDDVTITEDTRGLERALKAYLGLRDLDDRGRFSSRLREESLALLDVAAPRIRRDVLFDLQRLVARGEPLTADGIERVGRVALDAEATSAVRLGAVSLLSVLRKEDPLPTLVRILERSTDVQARLAAVQGLGARKDARAVPALVARLQDDERTVQLAATAILGHLGDPAARKPLEALRKEGEPSLAQAAEAALGRLESAAPPTAAPAEDGEESP